MQVSEYTKKTKAELLKAVDECVSISQLCELVQREGLVIRMQCLPGASNIAPKKLPTGEMIENSALDNLKNRVKIAVVCQRI